MREDPVAVVREAGGLVDAATLRRRCTAQAIRRCLVAGTIVRLRRGRYGVPGIPDAERLATELSGVLTHLSAALAWGWEVKEPPDRPHLTFLKGRSLTPAQRRRIHSHWTARHRASGRPA